MQRKSGAGDHSMPSAGPADFATCTWDESQLAAMRPPVFGGCFGLAPLPIVHPKLNLGI